MTVKFFYARGVQYVTLARKVFWPTQPFVKRYLLGGLSELKILVSVVRFRPGPPRNSEPPPEMVGVFAFGDARNAKGHYRSEIVRALKCTYNVQINSLRFEWDDHKATANLKKHGISFDEAKSAFYDERAKLIDDPDHSEDEDRFILLGLSHSLRVVVVCHCYRGDGDVIRIISARKATTRESKAYK